MIWLAYLIPFGVAIYLFVKHKKNMSWWEYLTPFVAATLLILLFKWIGLTALKHDVEYWGNYATEVRYYEDWNERVSCSHTTYCTGYDSEGNSYSYACGTDHLYDVRSHYAYYAVIDNAGVERKISYAEYSRRKSSYGNSTFFDLGRDYHTKDGDVYVSKNPGDYENYELIASSHTYSNKLQSAEGDYKFPKVEEEEVELYKLYDYPEIGNFFSLPAVLTQSYGATSEIQKKFDYINGMLGQKKEVRVWVLIFENTSIETAYLQEAYWKGGNKNEFTICIGINDLGNVSWAHVFSWTESSHLKGETKMFLEEMGYLSLDSLADYLYPVLEEEYVRREFSKLSNVKVLVPWWAIITTWSLTLIVTLIFSVWFVKNEYTKDNPKGESRNRW